MKTPSSSPSSVEISDEEDEDFLDLNNQRLCSLMEKDQISKLNSEESSNNSSESDIDELNELNKDKQSSKLARNYNKNKIGFSLASGTFNIEFLRNLKKNLFLDEILIYF